MIKVLYDIYYARLPGHSGIPQDTRLLSKTLSNISDAELSFLVHPHFPSADVNGSASKDPDVALAVLLNGAGDNPEKRLSRTKIARLARRFVSLPQTQARYDVSEVKNPDFRDAIWRSYFMKSLSSEHRLPFARNKLFISGISEYEMRSNPVKKPFLDTSNFDFAIFQQNMILDCSPNTIKIMRYHDPIPVISSDTISHNPRAVDSHLKDLRRVLQDSYIVCNSQPTYAEINRLVPGHANKVFIIPYTLDSFKQRGRLDYRVHTIIANRRSYECLGNKIPADHDYMNSREWRDRDNSDLEYVMMVSTIEPRKNYQSAVKAFNIARTRTQKDLKLVIVGHPGWLASASLSAMRSGVEAGDIYHLTDLESDELTTLYANCVTSLFPSYAEGFGMPPVEALQCGATTVLSDLPVHRWVMEDAAVYADPYDVFSIARQLSRLVSDPDAAALKADLLSRAPKVLEKFTTERTTAQWSELLQGLKKRQGR